MLKYKFKLEALLKVRSFKEKNIKIELGKIIQEVETVKSRIIQINSDIDEGYKSQDSFQNDPVSGQVLRFFSYFVQGKKDDLIQNHKKLEDLNVVFNNKLKELAEARGQTKVLEKMREEDLEKFKKDVDKRRYNEIEELFNMRKSEDEV